VYQGERATGGLPNSVVSALQRRFLVRGETRGGDTWMELVHDRFVEPIRASNAAWFPQHLSALQRQAALWDEQGRSSGLLLRDEALAEAEAWAAANPDELEAYERVFLMACRDARAAAAREKRYTRQLRMLASIAAFMAVSALVPMFAVYRQAGTLRDRNDDLIQANETVEAAKDYAVKIAVHEKTAKEDALRANRIARSLMLANQSQDT
jgi:hypothetical protein